MTRSPSRHPPANLAVRPSQCSRQRSSPAARILPVGWERGHSCPPGHCQGTGGEECPRSFGGAFAARRLARVLHTLLFSLVAFQLFSSVSLSAASPDTLFQDGVNAYRAADYARASEAFRESVARQPAAGALQNLGNAQWQRRRTGPAILAWEQSLWLHPFNPAARQNLRFARKAAQLEAPELAWYEVISTWLPVDWWGWIAGASFWLAVGVATLPGILRRRKATWHQAVAAFCLMVFLLSIPAYIGVQTRSRLGFVLHPDVPLRLTPTLEAQAVTRLAAGEPARRIRTRGNYVLIRTNRALGWVEQAQLGLTCSGAN